jgi:hypothetical protein
VTDEITVPAAMPVPVMEAPTARVPVTTVKERSVPEIEPVVYCVMPGRLYSDGVVPVWYFPAGQAAHVRSTAPPATAEYCVPGGHDVDCAVQEADVKVLPSVDGVVAARENLPAGQIEHVRSVVAVAASE